MANTRWDTLTETFLRDNLLDRKMTIIFSVAHLVLRIKTTLFDTFLRLQSSPGQQNSCHRVLAEAPSIASTQITSFAHAIIVQPSCRLVYVNLFVNVFFLIFHLFSFNVWAFISFWRTMFNLELIPISSFYLQPLSFIQLILLLPNTMWVNWNNCIIFIGVLPPVNRYAFSKPPQRFSSNEINRFFVGGFENSYKFAGGKIQGKTTPMPLNRFSKNTPG